MNVHCGRWFKKFCEGDDSLDDEGQSSQPLELTTTNWEKSLKLILYSHTRSCHRTQCWPMVIRPLKPIERWKSLISGFLKSWANIKKKKNCCSEVSCSLILCNNKTFLNEIVTCNKRWILYDNRRQPAQWLDWKEAPKHFPKPNLNQKGHGHCLVVRCQSDPLQLSEFQRNHHIWEVCSANQRDALKTATPAANTGHQRGPSSLPRQRAPACDTTNQRSGYEVLPHPLYSPDLSPVGYLFKHRNNCLQGKRFHKQQKQKMVSRRSLNSTTWIFFC